MSHKISTCLYTLVIVMTLSANALAGEESKYLSQEQLIDASKLVERYQKASKADRQRAKDMLEM